MPPDPRALRRRHRPPALRRRPPASARKRAPSPRIAARRWSSAASVSCIANMSARIASFSRAETASPPSPCAHSAVRTLLDRSPSSPASSTTLSVSPSPSSCGSGSGTNTPPTCRHSARTMNGCPSDRWPSRSIVTASRMEMLSRSLTLPHRDSWLRPIAVSAAHGSSPPAASIARLVASASAFSPLLISPRAMAQATFAIEGDSGALFSGDASSPAA